MICLKVIPVFTKAQLFFIVLSKSQFTKAFALVDHRWPACSKISSQMHGRLKKALKSMLRHKGLFTNSSVAEEHLVEGTRLRSIHHFFITPQTVKFYKGNCSRSSTQAYFTKTFAVNYQVMHGQARLSSQIQGWLKKALKRYASMKGLSTNYRLAEEDLVRGTHR